MDSMKTLWLLVTLTTLGAVAYAKPVGWDQIIAPVFGDCSDGDKIVDQDLELKRDMNYGNLTILGEAKIKLGKHALRVCGTLMMHGDNLVP